MTEKKRHVPFLVTTGLDPVVHADFRRFKGRSVQGGGAAWIAGSSPAMTI
jgi:hypothetical protein